jgi:hypothetical protein
MVPGAASELETVTEVHEAVEVSPQELSAVTQMLPLALPAITLTVVVPCPEVIIHPVGNVQL